MTQVRRFQPIIGNRFGEAYCHLEAWRKACRAGNGKLMGHWLDCAHERMTPIAQSDFRDVEDWNLFDGIRTALGEFREKGYSIERRMSIYDEASRLMRLVDAENKVLSRLPSSD